MSSSIPNAGFTPGPWEVEIHELSEGYSSVVYDARGHAIADHLDAATALLIAAAPDLYEALDRALGCIGVDSCGYDAKIYSLVTAALAKARGEA